MKKPSTMISNLRIATSSKVFVIRNKHKEINEDQIKVLEKFLTKGPQLGKDPVHWSCVNGSCNEAANTCDPGMNPYLGL